MVSPFFPKPSFFGVNTHTLHKLFQDPASLRVKMSMVYKLTVTYRSLYIQLLNHVNTYSELECKYHRPAYVRMTDYLFSLADLLFSLGFT